MFILTLISFPSQKAKSKRNIKCLGEKKELSHTWSCIISVLKVTCNPRWGWQVRCVQDELQMRGYQPRSPLSQNSSITSLLHNPNRTVHFLKNKTNTK